MNDKLQQYPGAGFREKAQHALADNPDVVFEETLRIRIVAEDLGFWLKFTSEWGGALYLLDEKNTKQYERGDLPYEQYEYAKRSYRLGLITLSGLHDRLKAWQEKGRGEVMLGVSAVECFFLPAHLSDYSQVQPAEKPQCEAYIQAFLHAFEAQGDVKEQVLAIEALVQLYLEQLHVYADRDGAVH